MRYRIFYKEMIVEVIKCEKVEVKDNFIYFFDNECNYRLLALFPLDNIVIFSINELSN